MIRRGREEGARAAGEPADHVPVLLSQVMRALAPQSGERFIDATFGAGGYTRALLEAGAEVLAIDRDPVAITRAQALAAEHPGRLQLAQARFSQIEQIADAHGFAPDGVVLDVGVSSMQLDEAARGFSFMQEGPLDMRMSGEGPSAADVVNTLEERELAQIFQRLGEEKRARAIAKRIVAARAEAPIETTGRLSQIVEGVLGPKRGDRIHPATRTFQGLRLYVNDELGELAEALAGAERLLSQDGRLVVVSFHSLEDRIVKRFFAARSGKTPAPSRHLPPDTAAPPPSFQLPRGQPVTPDDSEIEANPRARSARLRWGIRTDAPPLPLDREALGLPRLEVRDVSALG
ncbi:16S rRNA (cytosine(1402)-N(4))-methyltransferase RsmH [Dichotomicrobium thermohalophilum]|uniref:Ribosomal RNA small subunit methyltransferase H n=1 Tax=Dichotomicrobium thermohalophilum TaxID=933063 RepID=A0A397PPR3_9HYPH|nr:16S rRNA (cytosine1402-N4)-methyltransferase [Dichotomicrobium thermohalophilum]